MPTLKDQPKVNLKEIMTDNLSKKCEISPLTMTSGLPYNRLFVVAIL